MQVFTGFCPIVRTRTITSITETITRIRYLYSSGVAETKKTAYFCNELPTTTYYATQIIHFRFTYTIHNITLYGTEEDYPNGRA